MAARARPAAATGSARGEKRPRSTSSQGNARGECFTFRDQGFCDFGATCIFDHSTPKKRRTNLDHGRGGGRGGANSSGNGAGGDTPSGGLGKDGHIKPGGGAGAPGSSGGARSAVKGGSAAAPPRSGWGGGLRRPSTKSTEGGVALFRECGASVQDLTRGGGTGGIEQALVRVASNCLYVLSAHGGRFACMRALENQMPFPRVNVGQVAVWFGDV